jgi:hypothetical protein
MNWSRANATQEALAEAEAYFVEICDTDGEVDEADVDAAYTAMQRASADADEALSAIRAGVPDWRTVVADVLR